jgi:F-type H+-transporting ATPase subunit a
MKWTRRKFLVSEVETKKRVPVKRWIVLALILLGVYCAYLGPSILKPVSPTVVLPAEPVWYGSWVTNTILEFLWNTVEGATGKMAWRIVPVVATIFLLIFVANMVKLVPGFESIGYLEKPHFTSVAYVPVKLFSIGSLPVYAIDPGQSTTYVVDEADHGESTESGHAESEEHDLCKYCHVIPFLRGSATDLNFTFALAVIAVLMTQVYGVMALGPGYFSKFFQFGRLIRGGVFGIIDFGVGFLELILEFAKILSFSFRLFGNIFAGALLLAIVGSLLPVVIPPGLYFFEIFFGMIQAYVFFLLATMFISMALVSHHGDEHAEEHH